MNGQTDLISLCTSQTVQRALQVSARKPASPYGREVASIEAWVRRGIGQGWCKPVQSADREGRFRRRFVADLAMDCEEPYTYEVWGRYDRKCKQVVAIFVDVKTRCRKCAACLSRKAKFWIGRAMTEYEVAPATWMVTLTMRPEMHYHFDAVMRASARRETLATATAQFQTLAREEGRAVTAYLDRLRKRGRFRYLIVAERHLKNPRSEVYGKPHFHVLLHEMQEGALIQPFEWAMEDGHCTRCKHASGRPLLHKAGEVCDHAFVRTQWPHGHSKVVRCMTAKSAVYVCKYVVKDPMARIRASLRYGKNSTDEEHLSPLYGDITEEGFDPPRKLTNFLDNGEVD